MSESKEATKDQLNRWMTAVKNLQIEEEHLAQAKAQVEFLIERVQKKRKELFNASVPLAEDERLIDSCEGNVIQIHVAASGEHYTTIMNTNLGYATVSIKKVFQFDTEGC